MNLKKLTFAAGIALSALSFNASAQKAYKQGVITYTVSAAAGSVESTTYFKGDSSATVSQQGPAKITILSAHDGDYLAVLVDVPVASMKKAAVATPAEIEDFESKLPKLTFTPATETKQIAGFNCKKVVAKDDKGAAYDIWITNDISAPTNGVSRLYSKVGGFPVEFTTFQMGQTVKVTLKSITDAQPTAGIFGIPADYDKITMSDLQAMGGKR